MPTLSPDQQFVLDAVLKWYTTGPQRDPFLTLGGYAGTGKTTLLGVIRRELARITPKLQVSFASYTGKAARVLRTKLVEQKVLLESDTVSTIHSLIYAPIMNEKQEIIGWKTKDTLDAQLIIIDEGSMVDETIWHHLMCYHLPILVVGDHGQLPPIKGNFNLMQSPQLRLEQIHRQAESNPIIGLSIQAREFGMVRMGSYGGGVMKYDMAESDSQEVLSELLGRYTPDTLVLCGFNATRVKLNKHIRVALGFESSEPVSGDRVICLKNNHKKHISNGMIGTIKSISKVDDEWYQADIEMDEEGIHFHGLISATQFGAVPKPSSGGQVPTGSLNAKGDLFDFGYALTVHKAQGSQSRRVILFEERSQHMDDLMWKRWLYTAVTRAEEELYVFGRQPSE
ncbi:MAG: ATP-dependent RecD-like DNA helicase [bacterium]